MKENRFGLIKLGIMTTALIVFSGIANAEWGWSPNVDILSAPDRKAQSVRLASDLSGNVTGIWLQSTTPDANYDQNWLVQSARLSSTAEAWGSAITLGDTGRGGGIPVVAMDETHGWALWRSERGGDHRVQAALYASGQWAMPITISAEGRSSVDPEVLATGTGRFTGIWNVQPQPGMIQRSQTVDGGLQWAPPIDVSPVNQDVDYQVIVRDIAGGPSSTMTLWRAKVAPGQWSLLSSRSDNPGEIQTVYSSGNLVSVLRAASDEAGNVIAVWRIDTRDDESLIQSARWSNGQWSQPVTLSAASKIAFRPAITAQGSNNVTALWVLDSGTDLMIQAARFENGAWGSPIDLGRAGPSNPAREGGYPQAVADAYGETIAIWQSRSDQGVTIHSRRLVSGQWGPMMTVGAGGQDDAFPQIATAGHDKEGAIQVVATWLKDGVVVSTRGSDNPAPSFSITFIKSGDGKVVSDPEGIDCGSTCNASFAQGQYVFLFATPGPGQVVGAWSGDCAKWIGPVTQSCTLTMNGNKRVGVSFRSATAKMHTVNAILKGQGKGGITSNPAGIDCSNDPQGQVICEGQLSEFEENTQVTFTATPVSGSSFSGWSGACKGKNTSCTLRIGKKNQVIRVVAAFEPNPTLTVEKRGTGAGNIRSDNGSINCGTTCSASFDKGAIVSLTATPEGGSRFTGWGGACSGKREVCRVTLGKSKKAVAKFIGTDIMSDFDVVPEFCVRESPNFNAAQCLRLLEGTTNNKP